MGSTNESHPRIYLKNTGTVPITNIIYTYFFTVDPGKTPILSTWYVPNTTVELAQFDEENCPNSYFLIYTFNGVLNPGQVHPDPAGNVVGLHYSDWSPWNKTDDYSNNRSSAFKTNENIHLFAFSDVRRIWGRKNHYVNVNSPWGNGDGSQNWPFKNIDMVNNHLFFPGDNILFRRGTEINAMVWPKGQGDSTVQNIIDAYGTGAAPIIDPKGVATLPYGPGGTPNWSASVYLQNQQFWTIQNLEIRNTASDTGYRTGIYISEFDPTVTRMRGIRILNNTIRNVWGQKVSDKQMHFTGGISIIAYMVRLDDVLIQGNQITDMFGGLGIQFAGINHLETERLTWGYDVSPPNYLSRNVVIRNNSIVRTAADGIIVHGAKEPIIEYNLVDYAGTYGILGTDKTNGTFCIAGLWVVEQEDGLVQYNEVSHTQKWQGDGQGIENDYGAKGTTIFQYNYSHDNEGGFWMDCPAVDTPVTNPPLPDSMIGDDSGAQSIVRYNISVNDGFATLGPSGIEEVRGKFFILHRANTQIYNNTFYNTAGSKIVCFSFTGNILRNNIFIADSADWGPYCTLDDNYYLGIDVIPDAARDPNRKFGGPFPFVANPPASFPSPMGRSSLTGFGLASGSLCLDAGIPITDNGGKDFWGIALPVPPANPDIGACEKP